MTKYLAPAALYLLAGFLLLGFLRSDLGLTASTLFVLGVGVLLPAAVATRMLRSRGGEEHRRARQAELRQRTIEAEILRIAQAHAGKLTIVEIMSELAITQEDAQAAVDSLVRRQVGDIEITNSGVLVYAFHDIKHLNEKSSARGILE